MTVIALLVVAPSRADACTSAIVGRGRSASSVPLMWKHRDTGSSHNFIARHAATDSTLEYIALHNSSDSLGLEAWIGMNRAGLAVMNTASYNLAPDTACVKDREGLVMTMALRQCRTVGDFAALLDSLPRPMGVQANFGVMDATGRAAYFETNDHGYRTYGVADSMAVVRTNYSHSGGRENRLGLAREKTACRLLDASTCIGPETMLDTLSRRFYHPDSGRDLLTDGYVCEIVDNGDYIPRYTSTASIVIEAIPCEGGDGSHYVMWTLLGYPPCGEVYKVTFDCIPSDVSPEAGRDKVTPAERRSDRRKARVYDGRRRGRHRIARIVETVKR